VLRGRPKHKLFSGLLPEAHTYKLFTYCFQEKGSPAVPCNLVALESFSDFFSVCPDLICPPWEI